jgi:hypothetical protein
LARGWTRGGEIYMWVAKGVKSEDKIGWAPVLAVRAAAAEAGARAAQGREQPEGGASSARAPSKRAPGAGAAASTARAALAS